MLQEAKLFLVRRGNYVSNFITFFVKEVKGRDLLKMAYLLQNGSQVMCPIVDTCSGQGPHHPIVPIS